LLEWLISTRRYRPRTDGRSADTGNELATRQVRLGRRVGLHRNRRRLCDQKG
jgi:hypothetical protein